ncbi:MAG: recombination regulator RecX [Ignavibacteria bacterium]|nr:MAG: recombination regulator RecX [Ignavibacteria bacterium]
MIIINIVKKDAKNVVVRFDNNDVLILSADVFFKSGLKKNDKISDDRFSLLVKENKLFYIKQKAFSYLGRRQHSTSEIRIKLRQKGYETELINEILEDLLKNNYLHDLEFAKLYTEEKKKTKLWGKNKIKSELIKKGIKSDIIKEVLSEYLNEDLEYDNALITARKKYNLLKPRIADNKSLKQKLISFLNGRGYNYEIAGKVCDELINDNDC